MEITANIPQTFFVEEERKIKVDEGKKRLWAVLLDLLLEFDRVCKKHGIKYMIDGGTLLGAARHGGFIPWDDDIDVIMLREEYEKLDKIAEGEFCEPYFWQTYKKEADHGRGFARLRNSSTTYILRDEMKCGKSLFKHNQGVLIDIFICDNVPDDKIEKSRFLKRLSRIHSWAWGMRREGHRPVTVHNLLRIPELVRKMAYHFICAVTGKDIVQTLLGKLDTLTQRYNDTPMKYVSHLTFCSAEGTRLCLMIPRYVFDDFTEIDFEGYKFPATKHWDEYLTIVYGNWRKHVIATNTPGGIFIDLDNSYRKYL